MVYIYAFLTCGTLCLAGQLIYDNTKLTPGHITSLFVVLGAFLESFNIYDKLVDWARVGASLPITSFGHSLAHGSFAGAMEDGWLGLITGVFDKCSAGIAFAIFMAFIVAVLFKPKS